MAYDEQFKIERFRIAHLQGRYDQCAQLLTSPRFNRPQRELIEDIAYSVKDELEALGVKFGEAAS